MDSYNQTRDSYEEHKDDVPYTNDPVEVHGLLEVLPAGDLKAAYELIEDYAVEFTNWEQAGIKTLNILSGYLQALIDKEN